MNPNASNSSNAPAHFHAFRCSRCNVINYAEDDKTTICGRCENLPETEPAPLIECNICYDEKPTENFDLNAINRQIICNCNIKLCIQCAGNLTKCPFCRRVGFLRNTTASPPLPVINNIHFAPIDFDPVRENHTLTSAEYYAQAVARFRINQCFQFNRVIFEYIFAVPESQRTPEMNAYVYLVDEVINNIDGPVSMENFTITETEFIANSQIRPYNFHTVETQQLPTSWIIYIRDREDNINVYKFLLYTAEELASEIDDQLHYNISLHNRERLRPFIGSNNIRRALTFENPIWDTIYDNQDNDFLLSIIDTDEYIADMIGRNDFTDVLDLNREGFHFIDTAEEWGRNNEEELTTIIYLTDGGYEF